MVDNKSVYISGVAKCEIINEVSYDCFKRVLKRHLQHLMVTKSNLVFLFKFGVVIFKCNIVFLLLFIASSVL